MIIDDVIRVGNWIYQSISHNFISKLWYKKDIMIWLQTLLKFWILNNKIIKRNLKKQMTLKIHAKFFLIFFKSKIYKKFFKKIEKQYQIIYSFNVDNLFLFFDNTFTSEFNAKTVRLIENVQIFRNFKKINIKDFFNIKSFRATFNQF